MKIIIRKRNEWVFLFTCVALRAIYLESTADLSAEEFLHCFIARRGKAQKYVRQSTSIQVRNVMSVDLVWKNAARDPDIQSNIVK